MYELSPEYGCFPAPYATAKTRGETVHRASLNQDVNEGSFRFKSGADLGSPARRAEHSGCGEWTMNLCVSVPTIASFVLHPVRMNVMPQREVHVIVNDSVASANYTIVAQSRDEVMFPENSPSVSMWPYLLSSAQTRQLNQISVYTDRGTSREQARLLYMNAGALKMWREMRLAGTVVGESHRPPRSAMLSFGMPFSE